MSWMEQRNEMFQKMKMRLAKQYEQERIKGQACFRHENGMFFRLFEFPGENALCIEYEESIERAKKGIFGEDGDLFYLNEMTEDEMYQAMLEEIES